MWVWCGRARREAGANARNCQRARRSLLEATRVGLRRRLSGEISGRNGRSGSGRRGPTLVFAPCVMLKDPLDDPRLGDEGHDFEFSSAGTEKGRAPTPDESSLAISDEELAVGRSSGVSRRLSRGCEKCPMSRRVEPFGDDREVDCSNDRNRKPDVAWARGSG